MDSIKIILMRLVTLIRSSLNTEQCITHSSSEDRWEHDVLLMER